MPCDDADFERVQRKLEGLCLLLERKVWEIEQTRMKLEDILFPLVQKGTASRAEIRKLWVSDAELARMGMRPPGSRNIAG